MIRRSLLVVAIAWILSPACSTDERGPFNILWITVEDMSPHLKSFGDPTAKTPNLDRLAAEGIR